MPAIPEKCRLLHGPYEPPGLRRGDRARCHLRGDVRITSWADARISWSRCQVLKGRGGCGLLLDDELARAVRTESAAAVSYWWGVSEGVVWRWRKALEVTKTNNARTHQLVKEASQAGGDAIKAKEWSQEERDAITQRNKQRNSAASLSPGYHGEWWSDEELALLGNLPDEEIAELTGRTVDAVRRQRTLRGIKNPFSGGWTAEELALLGTASDEDVGKRIGRSKQACDQKRFALGIPCKQWAWTDEEIALIGTDTDAKVADRIGRTATACAQHRQMLRIPPMEPEWTGDEIALLGTDTDAVVAARIGRTEKACRVKRFMLGIRRRG